MHNIFRARRVAVRGKSSDDRSSEPVPLSRQFWVILHRWAGLTIALFLAVAGATGALLAFADELEPFAAPAVFRVAPPAPGEKPLDPFDLRERVLARYPGAVITRLPLNAEEHRSLGLGLQRSDPVTGTLQPYAKDWDEVFVNPYSGEETGRRLWGEIGQGTVNLFPFLYRLHYELALGDWGRLAFGIAALIWTVDCFVGFYLTFPVRIRRNAGAARARMPGWFERWKPAWRVRWGSAAHKFTFDLHRAGGLWIWPLLLVFAWSGVAFNLPQAYDPVMRQIGYQPITEGIIPPPTGEGGPGKDLHAAAIHGRKLAERTAKSANVAIDASGPAAIAYYPQYGAYLYRFTSEASVSRSYGDSIVIFSALTGEPLKTVLPRRENAGTALNAWLEALHLAAIWGLPYKIVVGLVGLMVTMLSVTGVLIWTKKRSARLTRQRRASGMGQSRSFAG